MARFCPYAAGGLLHATHLLTLVALQTLGFYLLMPCCFGQARDLMMVLDSEPQFLFFCRGESLHIPYHMHEYSHIPGSVFWHLLAVDWHKEYC